MFLYYIRFFFLMQMKRPDEWCSLSGRFLNYQNFFLDDLDFFIESAQA